MPRLLQRGYLVRCCAARRASYLTALGERARRRGRLLHLGDEAQLASTLRGASAAFYLVHSMLDAGPAYAARDRDLAASFGRAAAAAGIGRILFISAGSVRPGTACPSI